MSPADGYRPPRSPLLLCCLIWLVVPALAAAGRWPGALAVALIATVTTVTLLWLTRQRPHRSELGSPWLP